MNQPAHFGKYLLIDKVGTGGMAELFMAKQTGLKGFEKVMAIKRILPHLTEDAEFVSMFINEAKLAALLSHQNIVQIFDLGHIENAYFIAMEYVMGKDLRTILQRAKAANQPMSVSHASSIVSKVCAGLDYAHRKKDLTGRDLNIVHRDISPQNILVSYEGEVKLVDFGIAKAAGQSSETRTGILKGKLSYMAPEQARGKPVDRRTDIFAIGIVLYEILTGHKLFKGDNDFNTLEKVREAKVEPPPTTLNREVSPELEAIILKALAREPEDRFQSAAELQSALEDHMSRMGYDFSTVRLAQYLQGLFQQDIRQDVERFQMAVGALGTTVAVGAADQSTLIRRRPSPDAALPQPSRRIRTPVPPRPTERGPSAFRIMILTVLLLMGSATLLSMINPPFLTMWRDASPEIHAAALRLSQWPAWVLEQAIGLLQTVSKPSRPSSSPSGKPPTASVETSPPAASPQPPVETGRSGSSAAAGTASLEPPPGPIELTDEPDRKIPAAEREGMRAMLKEARTAYDERRLDDVEHILRRIIDRDPGVPFVYHLLGTVGLERSDPDGAARIFEEASRKFPGDSLLHYDLGFLYFNRGVASLARDELKKALRLKPDAPTADRARAVLQEIERSSSAQKPAGP
ncbi:MAG: protein kinase [Nitrospirae bacterium]|nr:protein kinase [Nitrospirota bacterium]